MQEIITTPDLDGDAIAARVPTIPGQGVPERASPHVPLPATGRPADDMPTELAELRDLARRLEHHSPHQLLARLRFRQVRAGQGALPDALLAARRHILDATAEHLRSLALPDPMRGLVERYCDEIRAYAEVASYLPPLDFPSVVHATACGRPLPGPVGAALLCYYIGLHMLDDVHDDELPPGIDANEASLVALTCVGSLPALVLTQGAWEAPRRLRERLLAELCCHALPTMTGQFLDISKSTVCDVANAYRVVAQRNGAIGRVFGRIAAIAAGCAEPDVDLLGRAVAYMSMASQVLDDIENLWNRPVSSDAVNRAKTLPLCFVLERSAALRQQLLELCDDPRPESHRLLRDRVAHHGGLCFGLLGMALFRTRARASLARFGQRARLDELEEYLLDAAAPVLSSLGDEPPSTTPQAIEASLPLSTLLRLLRDFEEGSAGPHRGS